MPVLILCLKVKLPEFVAEHIYALMFMERYSAHIAEWKSVWKEKLFHTSSKSITRPDSISRTGTSKFCTHNDYMWLWCENGWHYDDVSREKRFLNFWLPQDRRNLIESNFSKGRRIIVDYYHLQTFQVYQKLHGHQFTLTFVKIKHFRDDLSWNYDMTLQKILANVCSYDSSMLPWMQLKEFASQKLRSWPLRMPLRQRWFYTPKRYAEEMAAHGAKA